MDLSIIVPVYNVEKYVQPCLESILRQGLDEQRYEIIIVNDGCTDHSMDMIADLIDEHSNISIINQENQSLSVARNNGIAKAKGEYILMPDSDDLLIDGSLSVLLEKAIETKADLVVADFLEMNDEEIENIKSIPQPEDFFKEKTGEELFLEDLSPYQCYVWRTLFKRDFLCAHQLSFVPGVCYQDVPFTHECYIKAGKCLRTHRLLNIYRRQRAGSASFSFSKKRLWISAQSLQEHGNLHILKTYPPRSRKNLEMTFTSHSQHLVTMSCMASKILRLGFNYSDI